MGAVKQEFYTDADLQIGNVINVWGRPLKLVACDEFTQQFYKKKYDVDAFVKLENKAIPKKAPGKNIKLVQHFECQKWLVRQIMPYDKNFNHESFHLNTG